MAVERTWNSLSASARTSHPSFPFQLFKTSFRDIRSRTCSRRVSTYFIAGQSIMSAFVVCLSVCRLIKRNE